MAWNGRSPVVGLVWRRAQAADGKNDVMGEARVSGASPIFLCELHLRRKTASNGLLLAESCISRLCIRD